MNKYREEKEILDAIAFVSKAKAVRWQEMKLLQRAGEGTGNGDPGV